MINFTKVAWEQYVYWQQADKKVLRKINASFSAEGGLRFITSVPEVIKKKNNPVNPVNPV